LPGWSSNSRYAFLGAIRSASQMISYEVSIGLILMNILISVGSLDLRIIVDFQEHIWFIVPFSPLFILFFISSLAETNRAPFDLPEAEGELVAGFNVEYSSISFALFFMGEYINIFAMSALSALLFFGAYHAPTFILTPFFIVFERVYSFYYFFFITYVKTKPRGDVTVVTIFFWSLAVLFWRLPFLLHCIFLPYFNLFNAISVSLWFMLKTNIIVFLFIWVRAVCPRFRYDQLMRLTWKIFLPMTFGFLILTASLLYIIDGLPKV